MGNYNFTRNDGLDAIIDGGNDGFFKGTIALIRYFDMSNKAADGRKQYRSNYPSQQKIEATQIEKKNLAPKSKAKSKKAGSKSFSSLITPSWWRPQGNVIFLSLMSVSSKLWI